MTITLNGTTGIANDGGYTGDGVSFADTTPANTLVTTTGGNVGVGTSSPLTASGYTALTVQNDTNGGVVEVKNSEVSMRMQLDSTASGNFGTYSNHQLSLTTNSTEQARITTGGIFQFNSGYGSVATAYGCRAWVNFNGTGTVAIRASGNVSSITDNGTGNYTLNFTTAMSDANYSPNISFGAFSTGAAIIFMAVQAVNNTSGATLKTTTQLQIICSNGSAVAFDNAEVYVSIFR